MTEGELDSEMKLIIDDLKLRKEKEKRKWEKCSKI